MDRLISAGFHAWSSAWLALLLGPLVLFYFLKLRRPRAEIPSLVLWQQVMRDHRVNSPFQRFRRNLLLLLQILLLLLLVLAAMQPYRRARAERIRRLPVLVDCSASMGALDRPGGESRLEAAKGRLRRRIGDLGPDQQLCLIAFGRSARRLTGFTNNRRVLLDAIGRLAVQPEVSDMTEAFGLAGALARTEPFERVLLLSDGNLPARTDADLSFRIDFQRLPPAGPNVGLSALNARHAADGGWDVFAQVDASPDAEGAATLEWAAEGGEPASERLTLSKGQGRRVVFRLDGRAATSLRVRVVPEGFDSLGSDNTATLDLPAARALAVYVPPRLELVRRALRGVSGLDLHPAADGEDEGGRPYDLVIGDTDAEAARVAPVHLQLGWTPPALRALVLADTNGTRVVDWRRADPLLEHADLSDLVLIDRPRLAPDVPEGAIDSAGYTVLIDGQHGPLAVQRRDGAALEVAWLFDPARSTLPYRVAFPVMVANVVGAAREAAGLGEVKGSDGLLTPSETSLTALDRIEFRERLDVRAAGGEVPSDRVLWRLFAWAALAALLVEWAYFHRPRGAQS